MKSRSSKIKEGNNKRNKKIQIMNLIAMMKNNSLKNRRCMNLQIWLHNLLNNKIEL